MSFSSTLRTAAKSRASTGGTAAMRTPPEKASAEGIWFWRQTASHMPTFKIQKTANRLHMREPPKDLSVSDLCEESHPPAV